jgi:hypothetical protein
MSGTASSDPRELDAIEIESFCQSVKSFRHFQKEKKSCCGAHFLNEQQLVFRAFNN